jgi:hypothetical protein
MQTLDEKDPGSERQMANRASDKSSSPQAGKMKTLSLVKGRHHYCFRYEAGQEAGVLNSLVELVHRRDLPFDWFDAAILSHQLGQHLAKELKAYLPKKVA